MTENSGDMRVLVVEDQLVLAMGLEMTLENAGYEVVGPVGSLEEGLREARSGNISAALLDVNIRGEKVFPIADVLADRGIPYILLSGYDRENLPPGHVDAVILTKPVDPSHLLGTLAAIVR